MERGFLCLWFLLHFLTGTHALLCYWCSGVGDDRDCEEHPYDVRTGPIYINCRFNFCITAKVTDANTGEVKSFARLCDNIPRGNQCVRDSRLLTCYESCTEDYCNGGNPGPHYLRTVNYANAENNINEKLQGDESNNVISKPTASSDMRTMYKYNDLEAAHGFQEPFRNEEDTNDRNLMSPYRPLPDNMKRFLQNQKENLTSNSHADHIYITENSGHNIDEKNDDENDDSNAQVQAHRNDAQRGNVDADKPSKSETLRRDREDNNVVKASGSSQATAIPSGFVVDNFVDKTISTSDEEIDSENYVNTDDGMHRSEKALQKDKSDGHVEHGSIMDHHPSHYISSSESEREKDEDSWQDEVTDDRTDSASSVSTRYPVKTNVDPFSSALLSSQSSSHEHRSSQPVPAPSRRKVTGSTNKSKTPLISNLVQTKTDKYVTEDSSPGFMSSTGVRNPFVGSSESHGNPMNQFRTRHQLPSRSPFAPMRPTQRFSPDFQMSNSARVSEPHSNPGYLPYLSPMNRPVNDLSLVSSLTHTINPLNFPHRKPVLNSVEFSSRSPAYLYPSHRVDVDQLPFRQVQLPSDFNHTLPSTGPSSAFPRPNPYSGLQINPNQIQLRGSVPAFPKDQTIKDGGVSHMSENDVVFRKENGKPDTDLNNDLGPDRDYLYQHTDSINADNNEFDNNDAAFVESGYTRDSFDDLVAAFRQHPENRYPTSEEDDSTPEKARKEGFSKEIQRENQTSNELINYAKLSNSNRKDTNDTNSPDVQSKPFSIEENEAEPNTISSSSSPMMFEPPDVDNHDRTTSTHTPVDIVIDPSILITDAPRRPKPAPSQADRLKLTNSEKREDRVKLEQKRRNGSKNSEKIDRKRKGPKTTFQHNLHDERNVNNANNTVVLSTTSPPSPSAILPVPKRNNTHPSSDFSPVNTMTKASNVSIIQTTPLSRPLSLTTTSPEYVTSTKITRVVDDAKSSVSTILDDVSTTKSTPTKPKTFQNSAAAATSESNSKGKDLHETSNASKVIDSEISSKKTETGISNSNSATKTKPFSSTISVTSASTVVQIPTALLTRRSGTLPSSKTIQTTVVTSKATSVLNPTERYTTPKGTNFNRKPKPVSITTSPTTDTVKNKNAAKKQTNANNQQLVSKIEYREHTKPSSAETGKTSPTKHASEPTRTSKPRSHAPDRTTKTSTTMNTMPSKSRTRKMITSSPSPQRHQVTYRKKNYPKTTQSGKFANRTKIQTSTSRSTQRHLSRVHRFQTPRMQLNKPSSTLATLNIERLRVMDGFGHVHEYEPEGSHGQRLLPCRLISPLWILTVVFMYFSA